LTTGLIISAGYLQSHFLKPRGENIRRENRLYFSGRLRNLDFTEVLVVPSSVLAGLGAIFSQITDPRKKRGVRHPFSGVVSLVFLGLLGRITEMAVLVRWADAHWEDLREPLGFTREKPPCDTTISRILAKLSLAEFQEAFSTWLKSALADHRERWTPAIDGKTCRQGLDADGSPVQMLNVFLHAVKVTLDQWSIGDDKTNEPGSLKYHLAELLAAYPALQLLTGDAIFAQRPLLEVLAGQGRDYWFQIKANQPQVFNALQLCFAEAASQRPAHETATKRGDIAKSAGFGSTSTRPIISASV
jgi:hypothetical protein